MYVYWQRASILRHNIVYCPLCNRQHSNHGEWKLNTQRNAKPTQKMVPLLGQNSLNSAHPKLTRMAAIRITTSDVDIIELIFRECCGK